MVSEGKETVLWGDTTNTFRVCAKRQGAIKIIV